ncbi:DUF7576 family protein [Haloarchaeobius sp. DFWS5]|uniref:DUF7576 family protein n=1 Tax=Haloarchaeobius sp. DFWS5 TaxID=3446114 RepID=UPI003EB7CA08
MVDPTSDVGEVDPDDAPDCAACGDTVIEDDHRVRSWVDDEGLVQHRHFCDDECLENWDESA